MNQAIEEIEKSRKHIEREIKEQTDKIANYKAIIEDTEERIQKKEELLKQYDEILIKLEGEKNEKNKNRTD